MNQTVVARVCRVAAALLVVSASPPVQGQDQPPLTYQSALQLALTRNASLAAARRQLAIREAAVRAAGQRPNPELSFEASKDVPHEVLSVGFPIEITGQRGRRLDLAREEMKLADLDVRDAERALRRNLRDSFYGLLAADERVKDAEAVLALVTRVRDAASARFTEGAAPRLEVMEGDLGVARAETDLDLARGTRAAAQAELNAVLNQPAGQAVSVAGDLATPPGVADFAAVVKLAAASNGELLRVDREIAIEQRRTSLLHAERTPVPTFSIGGVFDAPGEFKAGLSGGVAMAIPLFSRNQGEIAGSKATVLQLQAEREAVLRQVESTVFATWTRLQAHRKQVEAYRDRLVPTSAEIAALAEESYRAGRSPLLDLLLAQRNLRDMRREYIQALSDYQGAIAELEERVGAPLQ
jgi:cobalt-zinc-cadmium efflux system outer membrane protein